MSSRPKLLPRAMSRSMVQLKLGSVLMSMASVSGLRRHKESCEAKLESYTESVLYFATLRKLALPLANHYSKSRGPPPLAIGKDETIQRACM